MVGLGVTPGEAIATSLMERRADRDRMRRSVLTKDIKAFDLGLGARALGLAVGEVATELAAKAWDKTHGPRKIRLPNLVGVQVFIRRERSG